MFVLKIRLTASIYYLLTLFLEYWPYARKCQQVTGYLWWHIIRTELRRQCIWSLTTERRETVLLYRFLDIGDSLVAFSQMTISAFADPANTHMYSHYSPYNLDTMWSPKSCLRVQVTLLPRSCVSCETSVVCTARDRFAGATKPPCCRAQLSPLLWNLL